MYAMLNFYKPFKTLNKIPHVIDFTFGQESTTAYSSQTFPANAL